MQYVRVVSDVACVYQYIEYMGFTPEPNPEVTIGGTAGVTCSIGKQKCFSSLSVSVLDIHYRQKYRTSVKQNGNGSIGNFDLMEMILHQPQTIFVT